MGSAIRFFLVLTFISLAQEMLLGANVMASEATMKIDKATGKPVIRITGPIEDGDGLKIANIVIQQINGVAFLSSDGGKIYDAIEIGRVLRLSGYETVVETGKQCASACGLIWLSGKVRHVEHGGRVGFHAAYKFTKNKRAIETGSGNALVGAYLNELGLSDQAIYSVTSAPPSEIYWLTEDRAVEVGIDAKFEKKYHFKKIEPKLKQGQKPALLSNLPPKIQPESSSQNNKKTITDRLVVDAEQPPLLTRAECKLYHERIVENLEDASEQNSSDILCLERMRADADVPNGNSQVTTSQGKSDYLRVVQQ